MSKALSQLALILIPFGDKLVIIGMGSLIAFTYIGSNLLAFGRMNAILSGAGATAGW